MNLESLKKSRTTRHTIVTKQLAKIDQGILTKSLTTVEDEFRKLEVKEAELLDVCSRIHALLPTDELEAFLTDDEDFRDLILDCKNRCNRFFFQQQALSATTGTVPPAPAVVAATARPTPVTAKLPKLQIPKFDGNISDYERFWSQFEAGVHLNPTLSKIDKFNYLLSLLTEKARITIKGLALTAINYDEAILLIQQRYGRPSLLVEEHIHQLGQLKRVPQIGNGQELRALYEEFSSHIQSLKSLGKDVSTMGTFLCHYLRKNLPRSLLLEWNRQTTAANQDDLTVLLDFVKSELEGVEAACRIVAESQSKDTSGKKEQQSTYSNRNTSSNLVASSNNQAKQGFSQQSPSTPYCYFCDNCSHTSTACPACPTVRSRKENLRRARRCFKCFKRSHQARNCEQQIVCRFCSQLHHTLLCEQKEATATGTTIGRSNNANRNNQGAARKTDTTTSAVVTKDTQEQQALVATSSSPVNNSRKKLSILQTMRLKVRCGNNQVQPVTILVDSGSERSFVSESTVTRLGLKTFNQETTNIRSFGGQKAQHKTALVNLKLEGENGASLHITVLQVPTICQGIRLWETQLIDNYLQDRNISTWSQKMGTGELVAIDILIGVDYYWEFMTGHMKRLSPRLMATQSIFGWMLQGTTEIHTPIRPLVTMLTVTEGISSSTETIQQQLKQLWELDKSGIMSTEDKSPLTLQDVEVLQHFEENTTYQNNRYQVRIPWKANKFELASNFEVAKERLRRMLWKLQKDTKLYDRYKNGIFEYLANGHAEEVTLEPLTQPVFYMPHHAIIREDRKTTKVRIVFDGSSKQEGEESLNSCQETGPSLNPLIFNLLLRFRWDCVVMVSDLEKAFLQILIHPDDRDAIRFIWTDKPWGKGQEPKLQVFRMCRVLFGMKSSPFLLAATIRHHFKTHPDSTPELSQYVSDRIFVDDLLSGAQNTNAAHTLFTHIHQLFLKAGMKLTKWSTNNSQLRELWFKEGIASTTDTIELLKILGLMWSPVTDQFSIKSSTILELLPTEPNTKRSILKILASVFDPLGFIAPFTIIVKKLLQDLWKLKVDWDDDLPEKSVEVWEAWKKQLEYLPLVQVPRWLSTEDNYAYQLHIFCDASPRVYATAAYIRFQTTEGQWVVQLITAKARLSPMQLMSIPRLELMACLIGSRLALSIQQAYAEVKFKTQFWSDSTVALQWIADVPSRWKLFVGRRVQEIQTNTGLERKWSYCPSKSNIADLLTRGQELRRLLQHDEWWKGPHWLSLPEEAWSLPSPENSCTSEVLSEEGSTDILAQLIVLQLPLLSEDKFGTWKKYMRVTAWIFRFINNCKSKTKREMPFLTYQEIKEAEQYWLRFIQQTQFPEEFQALTEGTEVSKKSPLYQFQPFLNKKQLICLGGRLQLANLTTRQKHPFLLRGGRMVNLLIQDRHFKTLHGATQITLAKLRDEVWILRGRQTVQKAIYKCMGCRKWNAKAATEDEAQLPAARVNETIAFQTVGIDFAGPVSIRDGARTIKSYICLFTCAVTRALHLELTTSQGLSQFLLAFRRFVARRGGVKLVFSDNGPTFHQTDHLLRETYGYLSHTSTQELATQLGIEWRFIAPKASWWGGFYERMVQSVKYHLRRSLGATTLNADELSTLLYEIEAVINNRPLLRLSEDPYDLEYLTPSHFLLGKTTDNLCDNLELIEEDSVKQSLKRRWKYKQLLMNRFWKNWKHDYLLHLRTAHSVKSARSQQEAVKLNDVVLVADDKLPRSRWKIATIVELTPGRDNKIRSVMLKFADQSLIRRAIQHICPLEVI